VFAGTGRAAQLATRLFSVANKPLAAFALARNGLAVPIELFDQNLTKQWIGESFKVSMAALRFRASPFRSYFFESGIDFR